MGDTRPHFPVLFFTAIFSKYVEAIEWGRHEMEQIAGPVLLASPLFQFTETGFYTESMGTDLRKQLFVFSENFDPAKLPDRKHCSNQLEQTFRASHSYPEPRPLNIDPGYLSEAKLVLATTKDRDHRVYLRDGIYGEVTLFYLRSGWQFSRWTYPDYRRWDYFEFLTECRQLLRQRIQNESPSLD